MIISRLTQVAETEIPVDSVRSALDVVMSRREFQWTEPSAFFGKLADLWRRLMSWLLELSELHPVAYWLLVAGLLLVLAAILAHVGWTLSRAFRRPETARQPGSKPSGPSRGARWHREEARRLRAEGRLTEALAHRFVSLLLELDRRQALRFHPSKTPREYVDEVKLEPDGRATFAELVVQLYRHVFGGLSCSEDELDAFERRADELGGRVAAR